MEQQAEIGFWEALLGTHSSIGEYLAFFIFCFMGLIAYKMARYRKKRKELRLIGESIKFSKREWIEDNILDFSLAFLSAFNLFRFLPQAGTMLSNALGMPEIMGKMAYGFILGLTLQLVWHKILNKVEVTINK